MNMACASESGAYSPDVDPYAVPRWLQQHPVLGGMAFGCLAFVAVFVRWGLVSGVAIVGGLVYGAFNWWGWRTNGPFWRMRRNVVCTPKQEP